MGSHRNHTQLQKNLSAFCTFRERNSGYAGYLTDKEFEAEETTELQEKNKTTSPKDGELK